MAIFDDLDPTVERALRDAGWSKERCISIDGWDQLLGAEGFQLSASSREVLETLGELRVRPVATGRYSHPLLFEPVLAGGGSFDIAGYFADRFTQTFYPVAEWISNACVFVGDRGTVVSYDDIEMLHIADSFQEALNVMILSSRLPEVIE